jgi:hypothetical protein
MAAALTCASSPITLDLNSAWLPPMPTSKCRPAQSGGGGTWGRILVLAVAEVEPATLWPSSLPSAPQRRSPPCSLSASRLTPTPSPSHLRRPAHPPTHPPTLENIMAIYPPPQTPPQTPQHPPTHPPTQHPPCGSRNLRMGTRACRMRSTWPTHRREAWMREARACRRGGRQTGRRWGCGGKQDADIFYTGGGAEVKGHATGTTKRVCRRVQPWHARGG